MVLNAIHRGVVVHSFKHEPEILSTSSIPQPESVLDRIIRSISACSALLARVSQVNLIQRVLELCVRTQRSWRW
jgi:hypothetical protein